MKCKNCKKLSKEKELISLENVKMKLELNYKLMEKVLASTDKPNTPNYVTWERLGRILLGTLILLATIILVTSPKGQPILTIVGAILFIIIGIRVMLSNDDN